MYRNQKTKQSLKYRNRNIQLPAEIMANPNRPQGLTLSPVEVDIVFFDFETTGGNPHNSSIIEIGAIKYSQGKEIGRFETLVNPKRNIPHIVRKITGIDNDTVKNAPYIEDVFEDFTGFIGNSILVAHGALGDVSYVVHLMKELQNKVCENFYFCTHLIVSNFLQNIPSKSLTGVADYFKIEYSIAHKAIADAELTCQIFWKILSICEKHGFKSCEDLLKIQADNESLKKLGSGINPNVVTSTPNAPGIIYLLNSHHEVSFLTATSNIKKSLQDITEIGNDKEMNQIIVDSTAFKFERTPHLLEALLREKRELKRVSLAVDPRRSQKRVTDFIQIFIPEDMLEYGRHNPEKVPFLLPQHGELHDDDGEASVNFESSIERSHIDEIHSSIDSNLIHHVVPIAKMRRYQSVLRSDKFKIKRHRDYETLFHHGHLIEGIGYCFGPFENARSVLKSIQEINNIFPFDDNQYEMPERFLHLRILIAFLNNNLKDELNLIEKSCKKISAVRNLSLWLRTINTIKQAKNLLTQPPLLHHQEFLRSGLGIISNNEIKEFEIIIASRSSVVKKARIPFEQGDRIRSQRYFTRLFENYFAEIKSPLMPIVFTEDVCSDVELLSFWIHNKKSEGEWVDFSELEGLFNPI